VRPPAYGAITKLTHALTALKKDADEPLVDEALRHGISLVLETAHLHGRLAAA